MCCVCVFQCCCTFLLSTEVFCYIPDKMYLLHKEELSDVLNYSVISRQKKKILTVSCVEDLRCFLSNTHVNIRARVFQETTRNSQDFSLGICRQKSLPFQTHKWLGTLSKTTWAHPPFTVLIGNTTYDLRQKLKPTTTSKVNEKPVKSLNLIH